MNAYDIIIKPVITEQSMADVADKKYVFQVAINANKTEIKAAVEEIFGVKVSKVNTVRMQGKVKRTGAYPAGRRAAYKKAVVTLTADSKTIEFFEGTKNPVIPPIPSRRFFEGSAESSHNGIRCPEILFMKKESRKDPQKYRKL